MRFKGPRLNGLGSIPKWFLALWVLFTLSGLTVVVGVIYIGLHFAFKNW